MFPNNLRSHAEYCRRKPVEGLRRSVADQQIMCGLLLRELQMRRAGADQNHGGAKRLTDRLAEIVLDIGAGFAARN
jgi:hypothetical protein